VLDSHTGGSSTRVFLEGVPVLRGKNMTEKKKDFHRAYDYLRTTLIQEPRGNSGILAILTPATNARADYGVIFCDYRGYVDMCLHGTIGVVTTLVECGIVDKERIDHHELKFDTPAGLVSCTFKFSNGRVHSVSVTNVPSFFVKEIALEVPTLGTIDVSIAFGGNFYAYVDAKNIEVKIRPENIRKLLSIARLFLTELKKVRVSHPENSGINEILGVNFFEDLGKNHARNIMVADDDLFDRSPCGTGTCGRMALNSAGSLEQGEVFQNESIIPSRFRGRILKETKVGKIPAIEPETTGSAYMTGISNIIVSEGDKLGHGYLLR